MEKIVTLPLVIILLVSITSGLSLTSTGAIAPAQTLTVQQWIDSENAIPTPSHPGCYTMAYPNATWSAVPCGNPPKGGLPPMTVGGNSGDEQDSGSYLLSSATGSFSSETGYQSEKDSGSACWPLGAWDWYSLQVNTNMYTSSSPYTGTKWMQFGLQNQGCANYNDSWLSVNFWLVNYTNGAYYQCPSGWTGVGVDCLQQQVFETNHYFDPAYLTKYTLEGLSSSTNGDTAKVCDNNVPTCWSTNDNDVLYLASYWKSSEFNILGYGSSSQAIFSMSLGDSIGLKISDSPSGTRTCGSLVKWTGETNNLNLGSCSSGTAYITFSEH